MLQLGAQVISGLCDPFIKTIDHDEMLWAIDRQVQTAVELGAESWVQSGYRWYRWYRFVQVRKDGTGSSTGSTVSIASTASAGGTVRYNLTSLVAVGHAKFVGAHTHQPRQLCGENRNPTYRTSH